jgi:hypothetical protein
MTVAGGPSGGGEQPSVMKFEGCSLRSEQGQVTDIVCRIQHHFRAKIVVVHLDRPALYLGAAQDE